MPQITGSVVKYPARASFSWYITLILLGALLLGHPACARSEARPLSWLDALFTATSAACVTGLSVRSTEHDFSLVGQVVILVLIQLGGIGIMTVTTYLMFSLGRRQGLRARAVISETLGANGETDLYWILSHVIWLTVITEGLGFVLLASQNLMYEPWPEALWQALFHSISAYCNAGFALHDDSLVRYQTNWLVNLTISALIILGGIGFPVILDFRRRRRGGWTERWHGLHLHSKLMLIGTALLLTLGTLAFLILEWDDTLAGRSIGDRILIAFFHSVSCRTAGFNTVDLAKLTNATLFISILLMAIGAGPCSTGGGFKVSTIMVLLHQAWSTFHGHSQLNAFGRTIPRRSVDRATATAMLFTVIAALALTIVLAVEQSDQPHGESEGEFLEALFEVVSALGTVGLSTGLTGALSSAGRGVLILLMFLGRLGPISVFVALSRSETKKPLVHPDEEPMIG